MMHLSKENTGILSESLYHTLEQYCHPFSALPKPSPLSSWKLPNDTDEEYEKLEEEIDRNHPESTCGVGVTNTIFETKGRESPLKGAIQYIYGEFAYLLSPSLPGMSSYTTENVQRTAIVSRLIVLFIQVQNFFSNFSNWAISRQKFSKFMYTLSMSHVWRPNLGIGQNLAC